MGSSVKYTETERVSTVSPSLVTTSVLIEIPSREEFPLSEETESVSMQRECFLLRVCIICMGTFVSGCSRNLCLSSKGMNALLGGEGGGQEGAQEADSCTSGLLCDQYSRGKWGLGAGMVSRGMTSCDLLLVS